LLEVVFLAFFVIFPRFEAILQTREVRHLVAREVQPHNFLERLEAMWFFLFEIFPEDFDTGWLE
jgi:hypothetical protein